MYKLVNKKRTLSTGCTLDEVNNLIKNSGSNCDLLFKEESCIYMGGASPFVNGMTNSGAQRTSIPRVEEQVFVELKARLPSGVKSLVGWRHCAVSLTWSVGCLMLIKPADSKHISEFFSGNELVDSSGLNVRLRELCELFPSANFAFTNKDACFDYGSYLVIFMPSYHQVTKGAVQVLADYFK